MGSSNDIVNSVLRLAGRRRAEPATSVSLKERLIEAALFVCGLASIFITAGILAVLVFETIEFFAEVPLSRFFADTQWTPLFADKHFGIWPLVAGTLLTSGIAIAVALPFGLMAAIYLSQYASERTRRTLKPTLELLAGVPTVVYGYFALVNLTPILQKLIPNLSGFNALSPGIIMGVMIIPVVSSLSEDALYAVPNGLREGALALGATKLSSIFRVIIPSATSGIAAALTLAISRAIGETMVVTIAAGQQPNLTLDPRVPIETMTAYIVSIAKGDTPTGTLEYRTIFVVGSTLFVITFVMNVVSYRFAQRMRSRVAQQQ